MRAPPRPSGHLETTSARSKLSSTGSSRPIRLGVGADLELLPLAVDALAEIVVVGLQSQQTSLSPDGGIGHASGGWSTERDRFAAASPCASARVVDRRRYDLVGIVLPFGRRNRRPSSSIPTTSRISTSSESGGILGKIGELSFRFMQQILPAGLTGISGHTLTQSGLPDFGPRVNSSRTAPEK